MAMLGWDCQKFKSVNTAQLSTILHFDSRFLRSLLSFYASSALVPTITYTAYLITPRTHISALHAHQRPIQQTIIILFLDLFDRGSQHLLLNCVPSTRKPPSTVQLMTLVYAPWALVSRMIMLLVVGLVPFRVLGPTAKRSHGD